MTNAFKMAARFRPSAVHFLVPPLLLHQLAALETRRAAQKALWRMRSAATEGKAEGSGLAIAVGALLDGVPESIVIGLSLLGGGRLESHWSLPSSSPMSRKGSPAHRA
jgi:ZIP family zinc transporter